MILDLKNFDFKYELPNNEAMVKTSTSNTPPTEQKQTILTSIKLKEFPPDEKSKKIPVFVLDDEKDIVEILSETLLDAGFEVFGFTDAEEALKQVNSKKPQAFFTDMNMPDLSGLDVLRKLNQIDSDIPLVYVSAHLSKEVLLESLNYGIFSAIEKPFSSKQIISTARSATRKFQLWRLLNRSINLVMYQYSSLEGYLQSHGMSEIREIMNKEIQSLLEIRRELRTSAKENARNSNNTKVG
jgi:DNA-binding NtrC family response regulator